MKSKKLAGALLAAFLTVFAAGSSGARAQTDSSQYVISTKAGAVNSASGDVKVRRRGANGFESLAARDALADGDRVSTGAGGRVEMLLSPGAYFRAAENTEFELENSSLDNLRVKLSAGSAIIEATGAGGDASPFVEVRTPSASVAINKRGIYRVNVSPAGETSVYVREGYALVGGVKVKEGRALTVRGNTGASEAAIVKFDEKERDAFDLWSASRAESLAAANKRLKSRALSDSFAAYRRNNSGFFGRGYRGSGFWLYDPFFGGHTFLPFYAGLSSPYGHGYRHGFGSHSIFSGGRTGGFIFTAPRHNRTHTTIHQRTPRHVTSGHHRRGH